jgi:hypothetical protein
MVPGKNCPMFSKAGINDSYMHWSHYPGEAHLKQKGENSEWHQMTQGYFAVRGAEIERVFPTPVGDPDHRADVVLPDGRVIEIQSHYLNERKMLSREQTYGEMAWIYDARDFGAWFLPLGNRADDPAFDWGKKNIRFLFHGNRTVYFDCGEQGIWVLESMGKLDRPKTDEKKKKKAPDIYRGRRRKVAESIWQFADDLVAGKPFDGPPLIWVQPKKDQTKKNKTPTLEWEKANPSCCKGDEPTELFADDDLVGALLREPVRQLTHAAPRKKSALSPLRRNMEDRYCQSCGAVFRFGIVKDLCMHCELGL